MTTSSAAGVGAPPSGTTAASGCAAVVGVSCVRPPPCEFVQLFHTRAGRAAGSLQHACACSGLCARTRTWSAPGHGRRRGTHTTRRRSSRSCPRAADTVLCVSHRLSSRSCPRAADTVCAREAGSPSRVLSLSDVDEGGPRLQAVTDRTACVAAPQKHQPPPPATRHSPQGAAPRHGEGGQCRRRTAAPRHTAGCGLRPQCVFFYPTLEPA